MKTRDNHTEQPSNPAVVTKPVQPNMSKRHFFTFSEEEVKKFSEVLPGPINIAKKSNKSSKHFFAVSQDEVEKLSKVMPSPFSNPEVKESIKKETNSSIKREKVKQLSTNFQNPYVFKDAMCVQKLPSTNGDDEYQTLNPTDNLQQLIEQNECINEENTADDRLSKFLNERRDQIKGPTLAVSNSVLIACMAFFPEVHQLHTVTGNNTAFKIFIIANWDNIRKSFAKALGHSGAKNSVLSQREMVQGKVDSAIYGSSHETTSHENPVPHENQTNPSVTRKISACFALSGVLSPIELLCTQPFAGYKIKNQSGQNPYFPSLHDKVKFMKIGWNVRFGGIFGNSLFFILGANVLQDYFNKLLPQEQYGYSSIVLTTFVTGVGGGAVNNTAYIYFTNTMKDTNFNVKPLANPDGANVNFSALRSMKKLDVNYPVSITIQYPTAREVGKKLYAESGWSFLKRGSLHTFVITSGAYGVYHVTNRVFDVIWPAPNSPGANNRACAAAAKKGQEQNGLFKAKPPVDKVDKVSPETNVEQVPQPHSLKGKRR